VISSAQSPQTARTLQPAKVLHQRDQYATAHISVSGDPHPLPAIARYGRFYSFFRSSTRIDKTLSLLLKLTGRGESVVVTPTSRGHALWVHEPEGQPAQAPNGSGPRPIPPTFGPADCWVISDRQPEYRTCTLRVPDLPDAVPGLTDGQTLYSLYRREQDGTTALKLAGRLTQRGDEVVLLVAEEGYILCIEETGATLVP
jgi:hypothetical protein